jgi:phosphatidate cytidylyltransferase
MAIAGDVTDFLERTARTQWGLMVCVYFISHIPMLLMLDVQPLRMGKAGLVLFLIAVTQGSDVLQYVWGKLLGKHPIVPKLSPKKTVEGFVGGVLCASALGAAMFRLTPFTPWQAFAVALLLCTTGFIGGLVMSAIKRARGLKDWGALIEGHGGMMDRMDSLCFSAPVFFHVLRYFFVA